MVTFTSTILPTCVLVPIAVASSLLHQKCNLLKARVIIYAYQHVRLLPPSLWSSNNQSVLRSRGPTLLCNKCQRRTSLEFHVSDCRCGYQVLRV
jgi:hypothetical protein